MRKEAYLNDLRRNSNTMSARDKNVVEGRQCESLQLCSDLSSMSKLAVSLHNTSFSTPCRQLFFSPNTCDTTQSSHNHLAPLSISSPLDEHRSNCGSTMMKKPTFFSQQHKVTSKCNEENSHLYYSSSCLPFHKSASPLQEVQNTINRSLDSSPFRKKSKMMLPSERQFIFSQKASILGDLDTASQDSDYSDSGRQMEEDCSSVPFSCASSNINVNLSPAKTGALSVSRRKPVTVVNSITTTLVPIQSAEDQRALKKFPSLIMSEENDAMEMDLMDEETFQDELDLSNLFMAPIQLAKVCSPKAPSHPRHCLSMMNTLSTSSRIHKPLAVKSENNYFLKRSDSLSVVCAVETKHKKLDALDSSSKPKMRDCVSESENHVTIMNCLTKSLGHEENLTGDFSKGLLLPILERAKQPDLRSISVDTLADILKGKYNDKVAFCRIIDCRYPYEYEGGHMIGAEMWHLPELISELFKTKKGIPVIAGEEEPRHMMVFHCEFSLERGPKSLRLLRKIDRAVNKQYYPALHFPEVYLLEGGYKAFYEKYPGLCLPNNYVKMLDPKYVENLKHFRVKSKSWAAGNKYS